MSSMLDALGVPPGGDPSAALGPGGPPPGPDPSQGAPPPDPSAGGGDDPTGILRQIVDLIQQYISSDASDDIETAKATKILTTAQELLAEEQKQGEAAMGTTPAHKGMARAVNNVASSVYGG